LLHRRRDKLRAVAHWEAAFRRAAMP
jgi:hypothetical protein